MEQIEIRHFANPKEVVSALESFSSNIQTKSSEKGFISYLETVMSEPGYDDLPYAIQSSAFGSLLNQDGELVFGDNLIHVSQFGILYGPYEKREEIRSIAHIESLPSLCNSKGNYAPLSNDDFYLVDGHENIYIYDTFGILGSTSHTETITKSPTPLYTGTLQRVIISSTSAEVGFRWHNNSDPEGIWRFNWNATFTQPRAVDQKQVFSDGKHCNDTKIYHQDYGIATDTGLKTKTMKKRALGYWDKVNGDMEAGIRDLSVFEELPNDAGSQGEYCAVSFGGKLYTVKNTDATDRGIAYYVSSASWQSVGNTCSTYNVNAVRYIDYTTHEAVTLFPDRILVGNTKSYEMNFTVPFGGTSAGPGYTNGSFHVIHQKIFGLTKIDNEMRGTEIVYNY